MLDFLNELGDGFQRHVEKTMGLRFASFELEDVQHQNFRFAGVSLRIPHIDANCSPAKNER